MNRPGFSWRVVACGVAVVFGLAGCTSGSADGPTSTSPLTLGSPSVIDTSTTSVAPTVSSPAVSPTPSVVDVPTPSSAAPSSLDPAAQEAADRAAIEAQWVKFWQVYEGIVRTPKNDRLAILNTVAVPPITDNLLDTAEKADSQGVDNYGTIVHRLSWQFPVNGESNATIDDCQDQSKTGTVKIGSGEILTTGEERSNMRGQFVRDESGSWRLQGLIFLETTC
jgi:hypothetical protein